MIKVTEHAHTCVLNKNKGSYNCFFTISFSLLDHQNVLPEILMLGFFLLFNKHLLSKFYTQVSEKAMAPHSSTLAWKIQWMEEPGRLQSMGSQRIRHD